MSQLTSLIGWTFVIPALVNKPNRLCSAIQFDEFVLTGRNAEAIEAVDKAVELTKRAGITLGSAGFVYAVAGKRTEALAMIKELEAKYLRKEASGQDVAMVYVGFGEKDKAFEWLEKDFQSRNGSLQFIRWLVCFEPLRSDPRFKDLLKRMGLPG